MSAIAFRREKAHADQIPHLYAVYRPEPETGWLDQLADAYVELRSLCRVPLPPTLFDGLEVVESASVQAYLTAAVVPRATSGGPLDIVRADLGEMLAYELLETEFGTRIGYKLVRDRETVKLPGRGIDAIGAESGNVSAGASDGDGEVSIEQTAVQIEQTAVQGSVDNAPAEETASAREPWLVLTEVKVSDENSSPPQVVDRKRDSMRNQHRAHIRERRQTLDKLWLAVRNCADPDIQEALARIALRMERGLDGMTVVACCVLVRSAERIADTDCGTFRSSPTDYDPAQVRFLTVSLTGDMETTVGEWDAAIERAITRRCGPTRAGEAA